MKKLFSCMAVSALLLASCSSEEPVVSQSDGNVTFTATLPAGIQSRSVYDDGSNATTLMVTVYDDENNHIAALDQVYKNIEGKSQKVNLSLVTGRSYTVVFWAQNPDVDYYDFNKDDGTITVKTTGDANDTKRDAFFAFRNITVTGAINDVVKLTRPFAQVNIGTNDLAEFFAAKGSISTSGMIIAGQPNVLDLRDGSVTGEADYVFTPTSIIDYNAETKEVDKTFPMEGETKYSWLTANFILVPESRSTVEVNWTSDNAITERQSITYSYVPVQRNYRTNIFGSLLTNPANFDVKIEENFDENSPNNHEIVEEINKAIKDGGTVVLPDDVDMESLPDFTAETTIDLNNHTLTVGDTETRYIKEDADVKFVNGNINFTNTALRYNLTVNSGGKLLFDNVTFTTAGGGLCAQEKGAELVVKDCEFDTENMAISTNASGVEEGYGFSEIILTNTIIKAENTALLINVPLNLKCEGCEFSAGTQSVFIRGGNATFKDCTFYIENNMSKYTAWGPDPKNPFRLFSGGWDQGNMATAACITFGNSVSTSYAYPTNVYLTGTNTFNVSGLSADHTPIIHGSSANNKLVSIYYNADKIVKNYPEGVTLDTEFNYHFIEFATTNICVNGVTITDENKATFPGYVGD